MRTTVNLDAEVLRAVRSLARERRESLGTVISALVREALRPPDRVKYEGDFPIFQVREDSPPLVCSQPRIRLGNLPGDRVGVRASIEQRARHS